jgi:hypothetical protein
MTRARAAALLALVFALGACTIGRDFVGNTLRADPRKVLVPGRTTIAETMEIFGAPDRIQRRYNGEIFVYRFVRGNQSMLKLEEPVITGITFFTYSKRQLKSNQLTLFFDDEGVLTSFGYTEGLEELDFL